MTLSRYTEHDRARWLPEPVKQAALPGSGLDRPGLDRPGLDRPGLDRRSPFARDRARVLHSAALRRLAGKTQVVGPGEGAEITGAPRTRLTHSLEVAQIGRQIATELGADPDVVDTAGLAHDIGHPPFGHTGERALNEVAAACGGFEANAQTLRILTRLEPKVVDPRRGRCYGLNLTRASLDATVKYPWPRPDGDQEEIGGTATKFGYYVEDAEAFGWLRASAPGRARCLEAQIMDWADDVAYSVHDVEDGILAGRITVATLGDPAQCRELAELAAARFSPLPGADLEAAALGLGALPVVDALRGYDASLLAQVALKQLTSELVGRFVTAVVSATRARYRPGPLLRYHAQLVIPPRVAAEVAMLKAMALRFVMSDPQRLALQARQRELIAELCAALVRRAPEALDPVFHPDWEQAGSDAARLRVVVDQVAALTDAQAVRWHL